MPASIEDRIKKQAKMNLANEVRDETQRTAMFVERVNGKNKNTGLFEKKGKKYVSIKFNQLVSRVRTILIKEMQNKYVDEAIDEFIGKISEEVKKKLRK